MPVNYYSRNNYKTKREDFKENSKKKENYFDTVLTPGSLARLRLLNVTGIQFPFPQLIRPPLSGLTNCVSLLHGSLIKKQIKNKPLKIRIKIQCTGATANIYSFHFRDCNKILYLLIHKKVRTHTTIFRRFVTNQSEFKTVSSVDLHKLIISHDS